MIGLFWLGDEALGKVNWQQACAVGTKTMTKAIFQRKDARRCFRRRDFCRSTTKIASVRPCVKILHNVILSSFFPSRSVGFSRKK